MITPIKISFRKINKYHKIVDDNGADVTKLFPLSKLKDKKFWKYNPDYASFMGGTMPKLFVRCDSRYFAELFQELKKDDCSYATYVNDLVKSLNGSVDQLPLSKLSIMLKSVHDDTNGYNNEEICSRIANIFGVPTVYNKAVEIEGSRYIASIDYMIKDKVLTDVFEDEEPTRNVYSLLDFKNMVIDERLDSLLKSRKITKQNYDRLTGEFIENFFFRRYVLSDYDYDVHNIRLLYDKQNNRYEWAPNYDYEFAYDYPINYFEFTTDLEYAYKIYPNTVKKIFEKYKKILHNDKMYYNLKDEYGHEAARSYSRYTNNILEQLIEIYNSILELDSENYSTKQQDK